MPVPRLFRLPKRISDKKKLGIYVHIPFCRSKCQYCDFYSLGGSQKELSDLYLHARIFLSTVWKVRILTVRN